MLHKTVGQPGSLYLGGVLCFKIELTCSVKMAFFCIFNFLFTVHKSFKNLAYDGICFMASNKGMLILTCLKVSKISWSFVSLLFASNLSGKGATIFGLGN